MHKQKVLQFKPQTDERSIAHYRRENSYRGSWLLIDLDAGDTVVDCRFYGVAATSYCVIWVSNLPRYITDEGAWSARGYGKAGGYGYHKDSAAMREALSRAGFSFSEEIGGVGETAMKAALMSVAAYPGIKHSLIVHAHP